METETPAPELRATDPRWAPDAVRDGRTITLAVWSSPSSSELTRITEDHLRAIVQQAYDQFGILAEPSLEREAERAPDLVGMIRVHVDASRDAQEMNRRLGAELEQAAMAERGRL